MTLAVGAILRTIPSSSLIYKCHMSFRAIMMRAVSHAVHEICGVERSVRVRSMSNIMLGTPIVRMPKCGIHAKTASPASSGLPPTEELGGEQNCGYCLSLRQCQPAGFPALAEDWPHQVNGIRNHTLHGYDHANARHRLPAGYRIAGPPPVRRARRGGVRSSARRFRYLGGRVFAHRHRP